MRSNIFTNSESNSTNVLGLDLGTTNSAVTAKVTNGLPTVLKAKSGLTTPSCVLFNEDGTYTIGNEAYENRHSPNAVYSFKKHMGTNNKLYKDYTPRNIASMFVKALLDEVKELNPQFSNYFSVQVSVPAYFDINQIEDTKLAIEDAGYHVVGVNDEPTAAALLYQQAKRITENILVFDLGGGTFDAVLIQNIPGIPQDSKEFYKSLDVEVPHSESVLEILDVTGDNQLGGDDIDHVAVDKYLEFYGMKVSKLEREKLLLVAEKVKKLGTPVTPDFTENAFLFTFVEYGTEVILAKCLDITNSMLNRAKVFNINCVLCGGSTKSSIIRRELAKRFPINVDIDPDLAVAIGNSIKYHMSISDTNTSIINRLAKGVGVLSGGRVKYLAEKGTIIPLHSRFVARNAEPFCDFVNIDLYQGERFTGNHTHVSTLSLKDIKGHNEKGYVDIIIGLTITSDGTISVEVESGSAKVRSNLILSDDVEEINEDGVYVHPEAKLYNKFKNSADHYNDSHLYDLLDQYRESGSRDIAKQIMKYLSELAN